MKLEIKEGSLVLLHRTLFEDKKLGFVWKKERKKRVHVIDPRVPELNKETEEDCYSVWVFEWSKTSDFVAHELSLVEER